MPQLTSSFASAAAGQNRDSRGAGRTDSARGSGSGDWPRTNGTRTFRRASTTPFSQSSTASSTDASLAAVADLASPSAQGHPAAFDSANGPRYTKQELLDIWKIELEVSQFDASRILMPTWNPAQPNGNHPRPWGKSSDSPHVPQDPSVCWDAAGTVQPVSFEDMSAEEREMFATDVNSTLKPPQQSKEGNHPGTGGVNGRKTSISVGGATNYPAMSPSATSRPGTRRRETTDTNTFPAGSTASPTATRFARDDPWLPRRSTELKESTSDEPEEDTGARDGAPARTQPFALPRSNTAGTPGFVGPSPLWGSGTTGATSSGGGFGNFALPTPGIVDKRFGTGGSRLAHLIPKDSSDTTATKPSDAPSWRPRQRTDTDPFTSDDGPSGSAALRGDEDDSPPPTANAHIHRGGVFDTPVKGNTGDFGMAALNLGSQAEGNHSASPSETNPYRSPLAERGEEGREHDADRLAQIGVASDQHSNFGTLPRSFAAGAFDGSDRSQTSSVGAKGFASVHPMTGWPAGPSVSTPDRERAPFQNAFGGSIFSPLADLPSPGLGGLGGVFGPPTTSRLGRGKLESLFPPAMQAQMHGHEQDGLGDSLPDLRQANPLGAIGRGAVGMQPRDTASPVKSARGAFEDTFSTPETSRSPFSAAEHAHSALTVTAHTPSFPVTTSAASFSSAQSAAEPAPVRTIVIPDRMRWIYIDPQGVMRGPFNGLEMHDWYKGNFFTPDLQIKRLEDTEFEPLGQLIRRVGNAREPFLIPQIGVPHGPPPASSGPFGSASAEAVPPLQSAFPSFGRTLTAQQQNDLERRKQEEQMYHARQRELSQHHHLGFGGLPPIRPGVPGALQHHSSAHSLQSQPSFGSMTSPIGMTPQHPLGPIAPASGFFDAAAAMTPGPAQAPIGSSADRFTADLNFAERQMLANIQATGGLSGAFPSGQALGGPGEAGLRAGLPSTDQLQQDPEGFSARLQEFEQLRAEFDAAEAAAVPEPQARDAAEVKEEPAAPSAPATQVASATNETTARAQITAETETAELTLTEKVRKTQADNAKSAQPAPVSDLPMPFPPPAQGTPLAAPTAQRPASNLPARYGERSASGTPDTTSDGAALAPPPAAPWAPQPGVGVQKGPSLKEIQDAEAKYAAKKEEAAAAAKKAALEQEAAALREREKAAVAAANPALPATSTWGTGSPVGAPAGSPWKQPAALKSGAMVGAANAGSKKTLADIQREEEARKQRAAKEAAAAQAISAPVAAMGKRYADLASKVQPAPGFAGPVAAGVQAAPIIGGWSTVGAGGKVKVPTGPSAVQSRAVSVGGGASIKVAPSPVAAAAKSTPKPVQTSLKDAKNVAMEEFRKWLHRELARGLIGVTDIETFAATLLEMPLDPLILAEAVYGYSTTMDGRHFAEEFVRRKKLADKGISEREPAAASAGAGASSAGSNGGWNEVAKKGGSGAVAGGSGAAGQDGGAGAIPGFRVVPSKKGKGKGNK